MKYNKYILLILTEFIFILTGYSQTIHFRHYKAEHGLSSNRVSSIIQDSMGFIWIGTNNGLNRFDGLNFKLYTSNKNNRQSIRSRIVTTLLESNDRKLWIGTDTGVDIFDPQKGIFEHFKFKTESGEELNYHIVKIVQDKDGDFWFATQSYGLFRFLPKQQKLIVYRNDPSNINSLSYNNIWDLFEDSKGYIWIGTSLGGLSRYSKNEEKFTTYKKNTDKGCLNDIAIHKIFEDSFGRIWIGTFNNGIALYNPETETFKHFLDNRSPQKLMHIHDINEYVPGTLIISSDEGLNFFNTETFQSVSYKSVSTDPHAVSDNSLYTILRDKEGGFWIGSYYGGVNYCSQYLENFTHYQYSPYQNSMNGNVVSCFAEDGNGNIWIGTDEKGVTLFNTQKQYFEPVKIGNRNPNDYHNVQALLYENDKLWIGSYIDNLEVLNLKTGSIETFTHDKADSTAIPSPTVTAMYKSGDGKIYVGTDNGACIYNPDKKNFEQIKQLEKVSVSKITQDAYGNIWFSTSKDGVFNLDPKTKKIINYQSLSGDSTSLIDNNIISICIDKKNRLWFGSMGAGFCQFDYDQHNFIRYNQMELPDNIINCMFPEHDYLWIATNNCIVRFNPETNETIPFSRSKGLLCDQYTEDSGLQASNGNIYFGGVNGFDLFNPQNMKINPFNPSALITGISIFNQEITTMSPHSPLKKSIEYESDLQLSFKQSVIGFEFAVLSYVAPDENLIEYKMEGFDKQWYTIRGNKKQITYTSLPAGKYVLKIRSGLKNTTPTETQLPITITPPFYKSNIALFLYLLLTLSVLALLVRYLFKRTEKEHAKKIDLLNAEKEREIYEAKLEFFTNIAHEIRTPLSLISGPLEYVTKAPGLSSNYYNYLNIIERNCNRLLTLVNQLLDFRKVETHAYETKYTPVDVKTLTENIIKRFAFIAEQNHIVFCQNYRGEHFSFISDEEILTKIISNLLTNALKYAHEKINISIDSENSNGLEFIISDDGPGIPDEEKSKIFGLFYQVKPTNMEDRKAGIGIGLHLTKMLTELLKGTITVKDNEDGYGISFIVQLPMDKSSSSQLTSNIINEYFIAPERNKLSETVEQGNVNTKDKSKNYTIMIVDDNPDVRSFLYELLNEQYFIIVASDGEDALKMLENNLVSIIISDVMMPGIDGFTLCRKIKSDLKTSHIPVILLTAKTDMTSKIEGLETGADAYIEKPFSPEYLHVQIKNLLQQRSLLQEKFANSPLITAQTVIHSKADEDFIDRLSRYIKEHINNPELSVDELAEAICMSRSTFFTKIKAITGMTPNDFIRIIRLKEAARLIKEGEYRVNEICFLIGFNSPSYFAKCFNKQFNMLPSEFINKCKEREM